MDKKHIDPQPDRRYLIKLGNEVNSATVIEATDGYVRLRWDGIDTTAWYSFDSFQPQSALSLHAGKYLGLQIIEELEAK